MVNLDGSDLVACPRCGSDHLNWRVKRSGRAGRPSGRTFVWSCRACSEVWAEAIPAYAEPDGDAYEVPTSEEELRLGH